MVIKGGARGAPIDLATHLQRLDTNERMEVKELRGVMAQQLGDALREMDAVASGTRCRRPLYHASINTRADEVMTPEQWAQAIDALEEKMNFAGQPRAVVLHEKEGREHVHVVWSRIDLDHMRAIPDGHNYRRHEEVARAMETEFGHARVQGAHVGREGVERPERTPSHAEMQQAERTKLTPRQAKEQITAIWQSTDSGKAFAAALEDAGWILARGDDRDFVVVDPCEGTHSLARRIQGAKAKDVRERMSDVDAATLPSADEARERQSTRSSPSIEYGDEAAETAKRGTMQEPSEDDLRQKQQREQDQLRQMEAQAAKVEEFRKKAEAEIADAQKREKERREQETREKDIRAGDISDAATRYSAALGQAGGANVYQTLANAALAEGGAFKKEQEALRKEAAAEKDPEKRELIDLRRRIEEQEYHAMVSQRLAGITATLAGREDNPDAERDRKQAAAHQVRAKELREERSQRQAAQEQREREQQAQERAKPSPEEQKQSVLDRYRAAVGRKPPEQSNQPAYHQTQTNNQTAETTSQSKEARAAAATAAYRQARSGTAPVGKGQQDGSGGKETGQATGRSTGRGGGRGR